MSAHRCTDTGCTYLGQRSPKACRCHKTDAQVLTEQRDALLEALGDILGPLNVCSDNPHVRDDETLPIDMTMGELRKARAAIARARTEMTGDRT